MTEQIDTYLAGVRYHNADGTSRQAILEKLNGDEPLGLRAEGSPHAATGRALAVLSELGQIGYVPDKVVQQLASKFGNTPVRLSVAFTERDRGIGFSVRYRTTDEGEGILVADITLTVTPVE